MSDQRPEPVDDVDPSEAGDLDEHEVPGDLLELHEAIEYDEAVRRRDEATS